MCRLMVLRWIERAQSHVAVATRTWRYFKLTHGGASWLALSPVLLLGAIGIQFGVRGRARRAVFAAALLGLFVVQLVHMQRWVHRYSESAGNPSWSVPVRAPAHCSYDSAGAGAGAGMAAAWVAGQRSQHPVVCARQLERELRWEHAHRHGQCDFGHAPPLEAIAAAELLTPRACRSLRQRPAAANRGGEAASTAIVFVILAYHEAPLLRRLLRALLHSGEEHAAMVLLDLDATPDFSGAVLSAAREFGAGRVCVARTGRIAYHSATALRAVFAAFRWWDAVPWWRWIVALSGADFPLLTPRAMVKTLLRHGGGTWQSQPSCCDPAIPRSCLPAARYSVDRLASFEFPETCVAGGTETALLPGVRRTARLGWQPGLRWCKARTGLSGAYERTTVRWMLRDANVRRLWLWFRVSSVADEHFFATAFGTICVRCCGVAHATRWEI
jgi:hypothetical protein